MNVNFSIIWPCIVTDSLWIKPTDALNSNFVGITTLHVSGSLSAHHQVFLAVHRLWCILCSCDRLLPGVGWNCSSTLLLVANGSSQLHKIYQSLCTARNTWWWAERLPETCRVVTPIKLEFSASVGFIHKKWTWSILPLGYKQTYVKTSVDAGRHLANFSIQNWNIFRRKGKLKE